MEKKEITLIAFVFSVLLNLGALLLVYDLHTRSVLGTIGFGITISTTIIIAYVLMKKIKNEFTKEKSNIELIKNLIGYFFIFLAFAIILGTLFGIVAVLLSLFISNEQTIINIINIKSILITTAIAPAFLWGLISVISAKGKTIQIIKESILKLKDVYIKIFIICLIYMIVGYILGIINQAVVTFIINIMLQTFIIQYMVKLHSIKEGGYKPWQRNT